MVTANSLSIASISSWLGRPVSAMIRSNWLSVEVPGKIGFPSSSSPNMHPMLHISTPLVYVCEPSRISGARYHLVATYSVRTGGGALSVQATDLTSPKSATLTLQSEFKLVWLDIVTVYWMALGHDAVGQQSACT